ncbi:MAG: hypothetical protein K9N06_07055 [Candidatus Cloacimonetes bacterium]|nr:hypothetical protein [Candidatus Cloacimonadota bacterium]
MENNNKKKAAIAAVLAYLQAEEAVKETGTALWARSGREITMNNSYLVQMRNFRR